MKRLLLGLLVVTLFAADVGAALIITPLTTPQWTGRHNGNSAVLEAVTQIIRDQGGVDTLLYKAEDKKSSSVGEEGPLKGAYTTTFDPKGDPDADIVWDGGPDYATSAFLLVKGGAPEPLPNWYLFDLTDLGWDGMKELELRDFWPQQGAISYVALYGTAAAIPEPASLAVWSAMGLIFGVGFYRRRR